MYYFPSSSSSLRHRASCFSPACSCLRGDGGGGSGGAGGGSGGGGRRFKPPPDDPTALHAATVVDDNCCGCNQAAYSLTLRGVSGVRLVYITYHVDVGETPFMVAVDFEQRAVVVSIRGTLSLKVWGDTKAVKFLLRFFHFFPRIRGH